MSQPCPNSVKQVRLANATTRTALCLGRARGITEWLDWDYGEKSGAAWLPAERKQQRSPIWAAALRLCVADVVRGM